MTHRQYILNALKQKGPMSCTQIAENMLEEKFFNDRGHYSRAKRNLTATLSGTLNRMMMNGEITRSGEIVTARQGAIFKLINDGR